MRCASQHYDRWGAEQPGQGAGGHPFRGGDVDAEELFRAFFGGQGGAANNPFAGFGGGGGGGAGGGQVRLGALNTPVGSLRNNDCSAAAVW